MLFLVPLAVVGYSAWKKQQDEQQRQHNRDTDEEDCVRTTTHRVISSAVSMEDASTTIQTIGSTLTSDSQETISLGDSTSDEADLALVEAENAADCVLDDEETTEAMSTDSEAVMAMDETHASETESTTDKVHASQNEEVGDESATTPQGPFHGLISFIQEQQRLFAEIKDPWRIKPNEDTLTYEVLGHHGRHALPFPKVVYK